MQLRNGKMYEIESVRSEEVSEDEHSFVNEPTHSGAVMQANDDEQRMVAPVIKKKIGHVHRIVRNITVGFWRVIRLIPTVLGIIGGVNVLIEFCFAETKKHFQFN